MMHKQYDAIIIGGGVAGLTAALHLAERGLKPLILEAGERVKPRLMALIRAISARISKLD